MPEIDTATSLFNIWYTIYHQRHGIGYTGVWRSFSECDKQSVADPDPGSGAFLSLGSGMGKKSGSGSGMNNQDNFYDNLETIFWVKMLIL